MCLTNHLKIQFTLLALISSCFIYCTCSVDYCVQNGPCSCKNNDDSILDLSPLLNNSFPLLASSRSYLYMYHPCTDVPLKASISNVCENNYGLCYFTPKTVTNEILDFDDIVQNKTVGTFKKLAINAEAVFQQNELEELQIVYKNVVGNDVLTTTVKLICNKHVDKYKLTVDKILETEHVLKLVSKHCCPVSPHHMSGAAVFFLIILIIFSIYFIGGILVLKFLRGAKGIEMIPNHEFWCKIPSQAMGALNYFRSCFQNKQQTGNTYESI